MYNNSFPSVYTIDLLNKYRKNFIHGISTRIGGVSDSYYKSLNLGLHVADVPDKVIENRHIFCSQLNLSLQNTVCCEQIHGTHVHIVTKVDRGKGTLSLNDTIAGTDGLVTDVPNTPLMLFFADCAPLLIYDPVHKAVGLSHAGWRGTVGDIAASTLHTMHRAYKTNPQDCIAGIGPCIGQCCYEIGNEVADKFAALFNDSAHFTLDHILVKQNDRYHLSLYEANKALLTIHGLLSCNIAAESPCTSCNSSLFYSYRADKEKTGRHAAVICLNNI
ncbi:peptidoglycan editing factor PgeF [Pectinatus frisingensis]|uniref:peptidoglycan editing factor PgeF n=1 Tax=Pectinatus frisingensis TaxID=865 RepID=UPI0018C62E4C|nr:peptidoglycan editing factor PgeF [Pectinatus frisingensis]